MTETEFGHVVNSVFSQVRTRLDSKGKECCRNPDDRFDQFRRIGDELGMLPHEVLLAFALRLKDGITAWLQGCARSRDIRETINDMIGYLVLLRGMIEERAGVAEAAAPAGAEERDYSRIPSPPAPSTERSGAPAT